MEKEKILRKLEKLLNRDFGYINTGRIIVSADSLKLTVNIINTICLQEDIDPNRIDKRALIKIIDDIKSLDV